MTDPYSILHVSRTASLSEIRQSFRKLALKYHPDKNKNSEESKQKFIQIVEAYKVLSDEAVRRGYDDTNDMYGQSSRKKSFFSNLDILYKNLKKGQHVSSYSDHHTIRYIGKTTNALVRKGPMILVGSIALAARSFAVHAGPGEERSQ